MRKFLGALVIIAGIAFAVYFGFWVMFIGSIISIIHAWATITAGALAWAIIKIMLAEVVAGIIAWFAVIFGAGIWAD